MRYADAGVNISVADEAKRRIRTMAGRTFRRGVLSSIGGFGALFEIDRKRFRDPILVASADGVGTKLKIAFATGVHSTVGADILNHCVNDILTQGAEPLFFLDYLAMGKLDPRVVEQIIEGMSRAAKQAGLFADRRRDGGDAGFLFGGRIRSCWLHRGGRGTQKASRTAHGASRRHSSSASLEWSCTPTVTRWRAN